MQDTKVPASDTSFSDAEPKPKPKKKKYNMAEKKVTKQITDWLKTLDECWWFKVGASSKGGISFVRPGVPDLAVIYRSRHVWLEVKSETGRLSKAQQEEIARMIGAGAEVFVVRSLNEVKKYLLQEVVNDN